MPFAYNIRPLGTITRRIITGRRRALREGELMDVCAQWHSKNWHPNFPIYHRRGMLHVTLCAHEGLRTFILTHTRRLATRKPGPGESTILRWLAIHGVLYSPLKYSRRISFFFFAFCLSVEWCWKVAIEKVDVADVMRAGSKV